ncbi:DinB family protein [uncultured Chryseobacterium sp.]|uniref:DinB family protein n=1 Tax=uncultured Chryseobacterium sp. TaxID=259322 RepID=UPI002589CF20|nr:DinB family protein [uncultured Chryseobacterium sp.]
MTKFIFASVMLLLRTSAISAQDNVIESFKTKKYNPSANLVIWPEEFNPAKARWYVYNEIEIKAKPEVVWNILIDAKKWHTYYKGIQTAVKLSDPAAATLEHGLSFKMHTMNIHLDPVIKEFVPYERMAWEVHRRNLQAYHAWVILPTSNGCKLITSETQNGFLTFLQKIFQPHKLLNLHQNWLETIKARAEETTPQLNDIDRAKIKDILNSSLLKFNSAVNNVSEVQLNFRPAPGKWTIAECIEHITLAELEFPKILEKEMQKPANPALRYKIHIQDDEIRSKMMSKKWKAKSPGIFKPSSQFTSSKEAIETFTTQRSKTITYVELTKDDVRNHYWKHPLTGKIDLYQTLLLMSAHLERHIEQIENIKLSNGFPR